MTCLYSSIRPRHVFYFIQFLLRAIAFRVSEELVVLITPSFCLRLTAKDHEVFQASALKMKNEGVDKIFMTADVSSLMLTILLYKSATKGAAHAKLSNS